jgi:cytochrome c553
MFPPGGAESDQEDATIGGKPLRGFRLRALSGARRSSRRDRSKRRFRAWIVAALGAVLIAIGPAVAQPAGTSAPPAKAQVCNGCHGPDGNSRDPQYPILAGQSWRYLYVQLRDFKEGRRKDPQMSPMAADLTRDEMIELGNWFASRKPAPTAFKADPAKVAAGRRKSDEVLCPMCHLGGFSGQNEIPRVAGQHYAYVVKQLKDFKSRTRTNDAGNMTSVAGTLSEADIDNLAHYIANLQ